MLLSNLIYRLLLTALVPVLVTACQGTGAAYDSGHDNAGSARKSTGLVALRKLRITCSEADLAASPDFAYFAAGHFGEKTQYNGRIADEWGGAYAVHCRRGLPFNIEVKYQGEGISRQQALDLLDRLLSSDRGELTEHDDEDLRKMDAEHPAEFFYYKNGEKAEFIYAANSNTRVIQVNSWTKDG